MIKIGQISMFIIIAVLIAVLLLIFFMIKDNTIDAPFYEDRNEIELFVDNCIEQSAIDVIYKVGESGGYYFPPNFSTDSGIPIYYFNGKSHMPLKSDIEEGISYYTGKKIFFCTKNFKDFSDLNISSGEIRVSTKIEKYKMVLDVEYPISISKGEETELIKDFKAEIPVRLGDLYDSASEIMANQIKNESICLSCLLRISLKNDFYLDLSDYDKDIVIFSLRDEEFQIGETYFKYVFANKYKLKMVNEI